MTPAPPLVRELGQRPGLFGTNRGGSTALSVAFFAPALVLLAVGAADLLAVHNARVKLQDVAEGSALAGAPALTPATDGTAAKARAESFVRAAMSEWKNPPGVETSYQIVQQGGRPALHVRLKGNRPSLFANMLPPGGWAFSGNATATSVGLVPDDRQ